MADTPDNTMDARREARDRATEEGHSIADAALSLVNLWRAGLQLQINLCRSYADGLETIGKNLGLGAH